MRTRWTRRTRRWRCRARSGPPRSPFVACSRTRRATRVCLRVRPRCFFPRAMRASTVAAIVPPRPVYRAKCAVLTRWITPDFAQVMPRPTSGPWARSRSSWTSTRARLAAPAPPPACAVRPLDSCAAAPSRLTAASRSPFSLIAQLPGQRVRGEERRRRRLQDRPW